VILDIPTLPTQARCTPRSCFCQYCGGISRASLLTPNTETSDGVTTCRDLPHVVSEHSQVCLSARQPPYIEASITPQRPYPVSPSITWSKKARRLYTLCPSSSSILPNLGTWRQPIRFVLDFEPYHDRSLPLPLQARACFARIRPPLFPTHHDPESRKPPSLN